MSLNLVTLLYLVASVCFIQALKGLSHPTTSLRGNLFGMVGMAIAMLTTAALIVKVAGSAQGMLWVLVGLLVGGGYGAWRAKTVQMTAMPQLVAFFHSMIGLAAVFIAVAIAVEPHAMLQGLHKGEPVPTGNRLELAIGAAIIEVSETPHTGCAKFSARFGSDALRWINSPAGRAGRMRGLNARVVVGGTIRTGDTIRRLSGPS